MARASCLLTQDSRKRVLAVTWFSSGRNQIRISSGDRCRQRAFFLQAHACGRRGMLFAARTICDGPYGFHGTGSHPWYVL